MTAGCDDEFEPVVTLLKGDHESRGVDAFCLAWIKHERQLRKLVAHLIYQSSDLAAADQPALRAALLANRGIGHTQLRDALYRLTGVSASALIGDRYRDLNRSLNESYRAREKIFHGQQTGRDWGRTKLGTQVEDIRAWCSLLSEGAQREYGYDGFSGRKSLLKQNNEALTGRVDQHLQKTGWRTFVASL